MRLIRMAIRLPLAGVVLLGFALCLGGLRLLPMGPVARRRLATRVANKLAKAMLIILNIKVITKIDPADLHGKLIVSNHMSYLDPLILFAITPALFVTSTEIRDTPFLGHICKLGYCEFTNRTWIWGLKEEISRLQQRLGEGFTVGLFPEGTTGDGTYLREFKSSLVEAAKLAGVPTKPIAINFTMIDGRTATKEDRDTFCWYEDMSFTPHFLRLLTVRSIGIELIGLDDIASQECTHRKATTKQAYWRVESQFKPLACLES